MIVIGAINVALGLCSYEPPRDTQPIDLGLAPDAGIDAGIDAANTLAASQLPPDVMRAFAVRYPRTIPAGASYEAGTYIIAFPAGASHRQAVFRADGTFVRQD